MSATDPRDLYAGWKSAGEDAYAGVLRRVYGERHTPVWTCPHAHLSTKPAQRCAQAELDRRTDRP